jgi:hypothetical protein
MDDPQRLLDGTGTALERTLLQELRSYHGPKNMRAHTLAALGVTGTTSLAAGSALAWWSGKTWGAKMLLTVSVSLRPGRRPRWLLHPEAKRDSASAACVIHHRDHATGAAVACTGTSGRPACS